METKTKLEPFDESKQVSLLFTMPWLLLATYFFLSMTAVHFVSLSRDGANNLVKEKFAILLPWLLIVEVVNQTTYFLAKKKYRKAISVRASAFWGTYTLAIFLYIIKLMPLPTVSDVRWTYNILHLVLYAITGVLISHYSLVPEFRFFLLRGKLRRKY